MALSNQPILDLSAAPLPSKRTLQKRRGIARQFVHFVEFSLRLLRMVAKSGHAHR